MARNSAIIPNHCHPEFAREATLEQVVNGLTKEFQNFRAQNDRVLKRVSEDHRVITGTLDAIVRAQNLDLGV